MCVYARIWTGNGPAPPADDADPSQDQGEANVYLYQSSTERFISNSK